MAPSISTVHKELKELKGEHLRLIEKLQADYVRLEQANNILQSELQDLKNQVVGIANNVTEHTTTCARLETQVGEIESKTSEDKLETWWNHKMSSAMKTCNLSAAEATARNNIMSLDQLRNGFTYKTSVEQ